MPERRLYLDHNATCPLRPAARAELLRWLDDAGGARLGNPSSAHADGRRARRLLEDARARLSLLVDCARDEIVFTSGGTEANALALGLAGPAGLVACSPLEHPSILAPLDAGGRARRLGVDADGRPDPDELVRCLATERPALVSVALANHELGSLVDICALGQRARAERIPLHSDASQALGRVPVSFRRLGVDLLTLSSHKVGGPLGIGALVVRAGTPLSPLLRGGSQEAGLRPGTEAAVLASAFAAATAEALAELPGSATRWAAWCARLEQDLRAAEPHLVRNSPLTGVLPNTLNVSLPGRSGAALVHRLDLEGISASHGAACATGSLLPSPVLLAVGAGEARARSSLRLSVGPATCEEDLSEFAPRLRRALADVQVRAPA